MITIIDVEANFKFNSFDVTVYTDHVAWRCYQNITNATLDRLLVLTGNHSRQIRINSSDIQHVLNARKVVLEDFANVGYIHDWRNYIPDNIRKQWAMLSNGCKMVAFEIAEEVASSEEWD